MLERIPTIRAVTAHVGMGAGFRYRDKYVPRAGMEVYTPNWVDVDGGDIYPGRSFTYAENAKGAKVALVNDKLAAQLFGESEPLDKIIKIDNVDFQVIGLYHYTASPMGTPTSGGQGDSPKAIIPYETGKRHLNMWLRGTDLDREAALGRDDAGSGGRRHRGAAGLPRAATQPAEQLRDHHPGPPAGRSTRSCSARSSSWGWRCRRSDCSSAASAWSRS